MLRTRKIMLTVLTAIMLICVAILGVMHINVKPTSALADTPTVVCQGIANDVNNNILEEGSPARYRTLLKYDATLGDEANSTNVVATTGEGIKLNGVKLSEIPNATIDYAHGKGYIQIRIPQSYQDALTGDIILEVVAGTPFENHILDASTFTLKGGKWYKASQVTFSQIRWNDTGYNQFEGMKGVLLEFSANLSNVQSEVDGGMGSVNLASTIGEYIYLGGVKLSTLPGALVSYYALNFLYVYADNMSMSRTLTIEEGTVVLNSVLPEVKLYYGANKWTTTPNNPSPVTFDAIRWNNTGYGIFEGKGGVLLGFSANLSKLPVEYNGDMMSVNLVKTSIGEKIKLGGTAMKDIAGAEIHYHSEGNLWIYAPNMTELGTLTVETTNFLDVTLPNLAFSFDGSIWGAYVAPAAPTVVCQGIANDVNNNILETVEQGNPVPRYRTLLAYDIALGEAANNTNVVSTVGNGIKLNGVKLSEIPNASIDYAHGSRYIQIKIPQSYQDALTGNVFLEVAEGTEFENQVLDASKFILRNGKWVVYSPAAMLQFKTIQWNDTGYNQFEGKKGVLLEFSANLSNVQSEVDGGMGSVNLASTIGEYIYLGGVKLSTLPGALVSYYALNFLYVYADNMSMSRTLTIEEGTVVLNSVLPEVKLYYGANKWTTTPNNPSPVTFDAIRWNNTGYGIFEGKGGVLLGFSANLSKLPVEYNGDMMSVNLVKTSIGEKIKLGGTALKNIEGAEIHYHSEGNLWIYAPNMTDFGTLTIETTNFLDVTLPNVALSFNGSVWENYVAPAAPTVVCQGIANDVNNNILETVEMGNPEPRYRTLLKYDITLGSAANTTDVVSTTGKGIKLNGVRLSEIPNAYIDYAHGSKYIQIKIPQSYQDALTGTVTLEVVEGTAFENQILDGAKFILRNGQWVTYAPATALQFTGIQWNDTGYNTFEGMRGVLLGFSGNLSKVQSEIDGGIQSTNLASTIGESIYVGGAKLSTLPGALVSYHSQNFLYIYADNMPMCRTLTIEADTVVLDSILPEVKLYYGANKWTTTPANVSPVTLASVRWNNVGYGIFEGKGGVLLSFSANLSTLPAEYNGDMMSVNLVKTSIGEKIKLGGTALKNIDGAEINYHSEGNLWIYAPNMTTLGNLTIETTNFLDVTLPNVTLAFNGAEWGTSTEPDVPDEPDQPVNPADPTVVCQGIANDINNNILETVEQGNPVPRYRTLLKYDIALGDAKNYQNVVSTTGQGILLNGVKLSDIPNTSIDYAHGSKYIQIKIPQSYQDALTGDIILEVIAGTTFENQVLDYSKFVLRNGQWATYKEPEAVEFAAIMWNNYGADVFEGKNGVLLSYSEYLSNVPNEVNGDTKTVNYVNTAIGEKIKLDGTAMKDIAGAEIMYFGTSLLWLYVPNMDTYQELTIESTEFLVSILPETHFAFFGSEWAESFKITHTVNGVEKVAYSKKEL